MTTDDHLVRLALLSLPGIGPARARWLLAGGSPADALAHLQAGRLPPDVGPGPPGVTTQLVARWSAASRAVDGCGLRAGCAALGVELIGPDHPRWPYADDPEPPILLFAQGDLALLGERPTVAIVGTRRCSTIGREVATRFGRQLAEAGVCVVSGLALGIDGAAHLGALAGAGQPIGVVATGLDVVYPRSHAGLWRRVAAHGLLISEALPGSRPERWRFPARNRLIAGLADVVVVVESHGAGGSLLTVGEAADRGVTVMAVPGAVTNPAAAGTNRLLVDGCPPACTVDDVFDHLGMVGQRPAAVAATPRRDPARGVADSELSALGARIVDDAAGGAIHIDRLCDAYRLPVTKLLAEIEHLVALGLIRIEGSTVSRRSEDAGTAHG